MNLVQAALDCLAREHERDLHFMPGRRLRSYPNLGRKSRRSPTPVGHYWKVLCFLAKRTRLRTQPDAPTEILLYAGYFNEYVPLAPLARELAARGRDVCLLCKSGRARSADRPVTRVPIERCGPNVAFAALALLRRRAPALRREFVEAGETVLAEKHFRAFCRIYVYLPYFLEVLDRTKPRYVVVANDHNPNTRCLVLAARTLGIHTVYIQHAAVTELFPALDFDYAFLDGIDSAMAYSAAAGYCERSSSARVFLSGQKKLVTAAHDGARTEVGLALNRTDRPDEVVDFVAHLTQKGLSVVVRPHPGHRRSFRRQLKRGCADDPLVRLSLPEAEPVARFLDRCRLLLAGNSSIHLEAAAAGIASYFVELPPSGVPDFYGFLQSGLIEPLPESFWQADGPDLERFERLAPERLEATKRLSATIGTRWQGLEARLVAETLERIDRGEGLGDLYEPLPPQAGFAGLWRVRA